MAAWIDDEPPWALARLLARSSFRPRQKGLRPSIEIQIRFSESAGLSFGPESVASSLAIAMSHQALLVLHLHDNFLSFQLMHKDLKQCEQMDDGFCSGVECGDRQSHGMAVGGQRQTR